MTKRTRSKKGKALDMPHEPSARERIGWDIEQMARTMTLETPSVKRVNERIKAKLEAMADKTMGEKSTSMPVQKKARTTRTKGRKTIP